MRFSRRQAFQLLSASAFAQDLPLQVQATNSDTGSLFPLIASLSPQAAYTHSFLHPQWTSMASYRPIARKVMTDAFAFQPPRVPLNPQVIRTEDLGTFTREKIVFSTCAQYRVPAYLHLPKNRNGRRLPAIVDLHSHGGMFIYGKEKVIDFGTGANSEALTKYHKANYESRPTATELVRRGYAVLTIDAFPFGERRLIMDEDLKQHGYDRAKYSTADIEKLNARCRSKESTIVKSLAYAGTTWPGIVNWDDIRSVDYLISRPEVDPDRVGCVGVSLGGYRSLLLAGMDDRIAAGCVAGFMSTVRPMIQRHMDTHSFVHFIPQIHSKLDLPDVVALRAPKPLFVLQCKRDGLFPLSGMEQSVDKLAAIYKKAKAPASAFQSNFHDVPHIFNLAMQEEAFAWFDKTLARR
jgi:dienelactone hydrolase